MAGQYKGAPVGKVGKGPGQDPLELQETVKAQQMQIETLDWPQKVLAQTSQVENLSVPLLPNLIENVHKKLHELKGEPSRDALEQELCSLTDKKAAKTAKLKKNEQEVSDLQLRLVKLVEANAEMRTEVRDMEKRMNLLVEKLHVGNGEEEM